MNSIYYIKKGIETSEIKPKYIPIIKDLQKEFNSLKSKIILDDLQYWSKSKGHWNLIDNKRRAIEDVLDYFHIPYKELYSKKGQESLYIEIKNDKRLKSIKELLSLEV